MKANEFVKKHGWNSLLIAKTLPKFNRYKYVIFYADEIDFSNEFHAGRKSYMFAVAEVKRLVESHELVEQYENIDNARNHLDKIRFSISAKTWFGRALLNWSLYADKLEQAIADVESCMEGL